MSRHRPISISSLSPHLQRSILQQAADGSLEEAVPEPAPEQKEEYYGSDRRDDSDLVDLALVGSLMYAMSNTD
jgi:hypothetical protein